MIVTVSRVSIPAMSTIGHGWGTDEEGNEVHFVGDHRPMYNIGMAMQQTTSDEPIEIELEDWQIMRCDDPGAHRPECNCDGGEPAL